MHSAVNDDVPPQPRVCLLRKTYPEQEFGFDLHAEKIRGQFVGNVDVESPAGLSGLKRGDRILAVNNHPVSQQNHKEVVRKIQEHPLECKFVVIDEPGYLWYTSRKMSVPIANFLNNGNDEEFQLKSNQNIVASGDKISFHSNGLLDTATPYDSSMTTIAQPVATSLSLDTDVGLNDHKVEDVTDQIAHIADIDNTTNESCVFIENSTSFDADRNMIGEKTVDKNNVAMSEPVEQKLDDLHDDKDGCKNVDGHKRDELPRLCKLRRFDESQEYGFNLHAEKNKGHFIGKIDPHSPADLAGLIEGYRIVGVNDTLVYVKTPHKEVVALIKQHPTNTNLLVVSPQLDAIYTAEQKLFSFEDAEVFDASLKNSDLSNVGGVVVCDVERTHVSNGYSHLENHVETLKLDEQNLNECAKDFPDGSVQVPSVDLDKQNVEIPPSQAGNGHVISNEENSQQPNIALNKMSANDIFQLSASEMRQRLSRNKKVDPRKESISIREKYEIIQNL